MTTAICVASVGACVGGVRQPSLLRAAACCLAHTWAANQQLLDSALPQADEALGQTPLNIEFHIET